MTFHKWPLVWPFFNNFRFSLSNFYTISRQKSVHHLLWRGFFVSKNFNVKFIHTDTHTSSDRYLTNLTQCNNFRETFDLFYTYKNNISANSLIATLYHLSILTQSKKQHSSWNLDKLEFYKSDSGKYWKDDLIGNYSDAVRCNYKKNKLHSFANEVSDIYCTIKSRIHHFSTRQLLFLANATRLLALPHSREIQRYISDKISQEIWVLELEDLLRVGDSLLVTNGTCNKGDFEFEKLFLHVCLTKYNEKIVNPNLEAFDLFNIITRSNYIAPTLLKELSSDVFSQIKSYNIDQLIYILTKYSQLYYKETKLIVQLLEHTLMHNYNDLDICSICDLVWSASKLYNRNNLTRPSFTILDKLKDCLKKTVCKATPSRLAMLIWAYSTTVPDCKLMKIFLARALQVYNLMDPSGLSNILYGFSITIPKHSYELFNILDNVIIENVKMFNTIDLATTSLAYCNINGGTMELHNSIGDAVLELATFISADCLAKILLTYGTMNCCSNVAYGLIFSVLERLNQFTTYGLCHVLWSFSIFKILDTNVWEAILPLIECEKVVNDSKCELLYPCLLEFKLLHPNTLGATVDRLLNLSKESYWKYQLKKLNQDYLDKVSSSITDHFNLQLVEGLSGEAYKCLENVVFKRFNMLNILLDLLFIYDNVVYGVLLFDENHVTRTTQLPLGDGVQRDRLANAFGTNFFNKQFKTIKLLHTEFGANGMQAILEQM